MASSMSSATTGDMAFGCVVPASGSTRACSSEFGEHAAAPSPSIRQQHEKDRMRANGFDMATVVVAGLAVRQDANLCVISMSSPRLHFAYDHGARRARTFAWHRR